jgi:hypothetical protein
MGRCAVAAIIHCLLRAAPSARLLVAATARREELDERHTLTGLSTALQAIEQFIEIELDRLNREDTALLAERISGAPLAADEVDRLYGDSEGNPLFVVEALKPDAPAAAARVQAVIAGRFARLSQPAANLAGLACDNLISAEWCSPTAGSYELAKRRIPSCSGASAAVAATSASLPNSSFACIRLARLFQAGLALFPIERALAVMRDWRDYADARRAVHRMRCAHGAPGAVPNAGAAGQAGARDRGDVRRRRPAGR